MLSHRKNLPFSVMCVKYGTILNVTTRSLMITVNQFTPVLTGSVIVVTVTNPQKKVTTIPHIPLAYHIAYQVFHHLTQPQNPSIPPHHANQNPSKPLKIINVNCQSLVGKKGAWAHLLEGTRSDVIIALETWHNNTIRNNKLEVTCYTIYRRDWPNGRGGGALIAVTDNIRSSAMPTNTLSDQLWVKLSCCRHRDLLVGAFYRQKFLIRH